MRTSLKGLVSRNRGISEEADRKRTLFCMGNFNEGDWEGAESAMLRLSYRSNASGGVPIGCIVVATAPLLYRGLRMFIPL